MSNPVLSAITGIDQILLGADEFYSGSGVATQRYFHSGIYEPILVIIQNVGDVSLTLGVSHSNDDADADPYAALTLRVRGSDVSSITVPARCIGVFTIEGFLTPNTVKKWIKVAATARDANARLSLLTFTGAITRVGPIY
jgi:hypothetical protein